MYINPLSKAKQAKQALADSASVMAAESSALEGNTASGMIDNQHHAGLQTEYRLKSFSSAVARTPLAPDAEEPRIPQVRAQRNCSICTLKISPRKS